MKAKLLTVIAVIAFTLAACDDNTLEMGSTITPTSDSLNISTDTFSVVTKSIIADSVLARSVGGSIGKVKDPETGSYITSNFMTQFSKLENVNFYSEDSVVSRINGEVVADSCDIKLFVSSFYGDSLNLMKLTAYELDKPVEEGTNYYSNYSIENNGYIRKVANGGIQKDKSYTMVDLNVDYDTRYSTSYTRNIRIPLNSSYTDKEGKTYNNYGTYLMRKYYDSKTSKYYKNSYSFIHNICPGFYFKFKSGLGNMAQVSIAGINVYYRCTSKDSIYNISEVFPGTEEVLQTTNITNDTQSLNKLVNDNSCTYLKTPSGIFTEMTLPVEDIYLKHQNDTLNSAKIKLTRINNSEQNTYNLSIPSTLLMIEKDSLTSFFESSKIINYKNSFIASYSSSTNSYTFNNFSGIVTRMQNAKTAGVAADPNWISKHPNWNKVLIIPITATYSSTTSSTSISKVVHNMALGSTKLVGGITPLTMSVVYSKFTNK